MNSFTVSQCMQLLGLVSEIVTFSPRLGYFEHLALEELDLRLAGPGGERLGDLLLEPGDEVGVRLVGHDGQLVDVVDGDGVVHALAVLVDGDAETAADLLAAGDGVVALLEHPHHEDVGVVPALAKRGVGEDEPHRFVERQQALLVLQDQVVGVDVGRLARLLAASWRPSGRPGAWSSCRSRSSPRESLRTASRWRYSRYAVVASSSSSSPKTSATASRVLLLEDAGVVAERVLPVVVAVLRHLVDEEQREHLDALREQLALLVEVGSDHLSDLDATLRLLGDITVGELSSDDHVTVAELDHVADGVDVRDDEIPVGLDSVGEVVEARALA